MVLASMIKLDKNALICDFAETYRIYDLWALPARYVSILAVGLKNSSRIKISKSDTSIEFKELLLASILDNLAMINYKLSDQAEPPESITAKLLDIEDEASSVVFGSIEDYRLARKKIINGG